MKIPKSKSVESFNHETRSYSHLSPALDWEITERPIYRQDGSEIDGYKQVIRNDSQQTLHICKGSYTPARNELLMQSAFDLAEKTGFTVAGFDSFEQGRKVLAFLENPNPDTVDGFKFKDFLMLGNAHDGSSSFWLGNTSVMIRCGNQFTVKNQQFKVSHTTNSTGRIGQLLKAFEIYTKQNNIMYEDFKAFQGIDIDNFLIEKSIQRVLDMGQEETSVRKANIYKEVEAAVYKECFEVGKNLFGLFNGFTYYTTHVRRAKEKAFGNAFDSCQRINETAYQFCKAIATQPGEQKEFLRIAG